MIRHLVATAGLALLVFATQAKEGQTQTVAIVGGKVFPVSGPVIDGGTVVFSNGKITAVGQNLPIPPGASRIDAAGKWVTPGLFNATTTLGVVEVDSVAPTNDASATGERGVAAAFRVWDALNPDSALWAPARQDGVTHAVVLPGGGFVGGQAALVETLEGPRAEMIRKAPIGITVDLTDRESAGAESRGELLLRLRELLENAKLYGTPGANFDTPQLRALWAGRVHLRALAPVVRGELPLLVHADRAADIDGVLSLAREYALKMIVYGGTEAWKVAPRLAAARVPVVVGGLSDLPDTFDQLGATLENAARLQAAGVRLVITSESENNFKVRTIRQHAGNAVANGLAWGDALRAVTLTPAEVFGVSSTIGSLQPGREANVVIWSGDPFELTTQAERVFVRGRESNARSREQLLVERYKRPR